jgi:hypothetical protein
MEKIMANPVDVDPSFVPKLDDFDPAVMEENWNLSNAEYADILARQRTLEVERQKLIEEFRAGRSRLQKFLDRLIPV